MIKTIFLILIFVPINIVLGYLIAMRLRLAPPAMKDSYNITRDYYLNFRERVRPLQIWCVKLYTTAREKSQPFIDKGVAIYGTIHEKVIVRVIEFVQKFIPAKKVKVDIGAKDLIVEPTLAEAVAFVEAANIVDLINDRIRFVVGGAQTAGSKFGDDGGGKGGSFMVKKRRLEQVRSGQHVADMDKRLRVMMVAPDTPGIALLVADLNEEMKQIQTLLGSLLRELKARAPYAGGKLNATVTYVDAISEEVTPQVDSMLAEIAALETVVKPPEIPTPENPENPENPVAEVPAPPPFVLSQDVLVATREKITPLFWQNVLLRHRIRDLQGEINALYARLDSNFEDAKPEDMINAAMIITNRMGIDAATAAWWKGGIPAIGKICFAFFDFHDTHRLNEECSLSSTDKILRYLGRELKTAFHGEKNVVGLFRGSCFCVITQGHEFHAIEEKIHKAQVHLNQTKVTWTADEKTHEWQPQVTCCVVGVQPAFSENEMISRATLAIAAAKEAGAGSLFSLPGDRAPDQVAAAPFTKPAETSVHTFSLDDLEMWEEIDIYAAKIVKSPQETSAFIHRATMYLRVDKPDLAAKDLDSAVSAEPDKIPHYINRGVFLRWRKRYDQALDDFNKIFELQQIHAGALKNRAITYSVKGDAAAAQEDYDNLIKLVGVTPPKT